MVIDGVVPLFNNHVCAEAVTSLPLVPPAGIEPAALGLGIPRSIQLS